MEYRHTQPGWIIIAAVVAAIVFFVFSPSGSQASQLNRDLEALLVVAILGLFSSLTVEIKEGFLRCRLGPGIIRRRFLLTDIEEARSVRNPWYAGWGIRWRPDQYVLWNVSGRNAVELVLKGGKRFRIGTDEPDVFVQAIQKNKPPYSTTI